MQAWRTEEQISSTAVLILAVVAFGCTLVGGLGVSLLIRPFFLEGVWIAAILVCYESPRKLLPFLVALVLSCTLLNINIFAVLMACVLQLLIVRGLQGRIEQSHPVVSVLLALLWLLCLIAADEATVYNNLISVIPNYSALQALEVVVAAIVWRHIFSKILLPYSQL